MIQLIIIFFGVNKILQNVCGVTNLVLLIATNLRVCLVGVFWRGWKERGAEQNSSYIHLFASPKLEGFGGEER
jgi:hypothetical protein